MDGTEENQEVDLPPVLEDLIRRARCLLSELEAFRARLRTMKQEGNVELGHFRGTVQSELGMLERLSNKPDSDATTHIARSSNLPFLERVWITVKGSRSLVALQKRIYTSSAVQLHAHGMRHVDSNGDGTKLKNVKETAVIVDAITDGGRTWTKVSLVTNSRLLFDLAKQGWDSGGSEDGFDEDGMPNVMDDDFEREVPLFKTAKELVKAAKLFRVRTQAPRVQLVLPRVEPGTTAEIDAILDDCRAAGAIVRCGQDLETPADIHTALKNMAPDPVESFTDVLNIDCTILLALVSEFSHAKVSKEPWFHAALRRQVEIEGNENLLPSLLYPAMSSRRLVATKEAAKRMQEIVDTIGTPSEKARTAIMMGHDNAKTRAQLLQEMKEWSAYEVPPDWQLPIQVIDQNGDDCQSKLPAEAFEVSKDMTAINRSVFLCGWAMGQTTITSNRTVVKQIETDLEKFRDMDDAVWPKIWLCPTARSLVGKEKRGARKEAAARPLPDPLKREQQRRNGLDVLSLREGHEVADLRPNGYPCDDVLAAKNASIRS